MGLHLAAIVSAVNPALPALLLGRGAAAAAPDACLHNGASFACVRRSELMEPISAAAINEEEEDEEEET